MTGLLLDKWDVVQEVAPLEQAPLNPLHDCTGPLLKAAVLQMAAEKQADWDDFLDPVLFLVRTAVNPTTKFSPYSLMFNREAHFPNQVETASRSRITSPRFGLLMFWVCLFGFFCIFQTTSNARIYDEQQDVFSAKEQAYMSVMEEQQDSVKQLVIRVYNPLQNSFTAFSSHSCILVFSFFTCTRRCGFA